MQSNQREHQTLEILHQIVEAAQTFRVLGLIDVQQRARLRCRERDVLITNDDFQFLHENNIVYTLLSYTFTQTKIRLSHHS